MSGAGVGSPSYEAMSPQIAIRAKSLIRRIAWRNGSPPTFSNSPSMPSGSAAFSSSAKFGDL